MPSLSSFFQWFAGGDQPYMRLRDCMNGDTFWIALTVALDMAVAAGYMMIAMHWWRNCQYMPNTPAKRALGNMRNIFIFCGVCGYAFIPIKMIWPAWRLYDFFMLALVYFTWQYAWSARDLKVIYSELGRSNRLAKDLERTQEESRQKSLFLNSISHDLRTPLNGLVLQTNLARVAVKNNDTQLVEATLHEIEASAHATTELLDRLLEYARLNATEERNALSVFNLSQLMNQVFRGQNAHASTKQLALNQRIPADLFLHTDPVKLERILANLVNNAIKYTHQGSVTVDAEVMNESVELHVTDTGIGISAEDQQGLFQEFFQAGNAERDRAKGFGLGLATARRLALQLGGDLTVASSPGNGARFSILLPGAVVKAPATLAGAVSAVMASSTSN